MEYYTNTQQEQRVILAAADLGGFDAESSMDELEELAHTAGAQVISRLIQKRTEMDKATCIGAGRLEELRDAAQNENIDLIIFDCELSASQLRNIEQAVGIPVIDRTMLILDIFAQRAVSSEGKLQVELAQQRYMLPRLTGMGSVLSRLGGGIGTRGPGETKLESDKRHIRRRIQSLERQLKQLTARRSQLRVRRKKDGVLTAAIVGYTNVGKSTLLRALTQAEVLCEDKLFATLDPTARALQLPDGRSVLLIDTVGLIRRLPHHLIEAFKSTLEEAASADILLNVCDISSPELQTQLSVTEQLMAELGVGGTPMLTVYNKCDTVDEIPFPLNKNTVLVSARTGYGFDNLLQSIARTLTPTQKRLRLLVPYAHGSLINEIMDGGKIFQQEYTESGILLDALVSVKLLYKLDNMILPPA